MTHLDRTPYRKASISSLRSRLSARLFIIAFLTGLMARAPLSAQDTLLLESFDSVVEPNLPSGWSTDGSEWSTSTSSSSSGSGLNNLAQSGMTPASATTPPIDFSTYSNGVLSFLARRTSSYPQDSLRIRASIDGGATFPIPIAETGGALPSATSTWDAISISLPPALDGLSSVVLRFEALGGTTGGSNIRIDDVEITAENGGPPPPPPSTGNTLGFSEPASSVEESIGLLDIPLNLDAADSLVGIQFTLSWTSNVVQFSDLVRGPAFSDTSAWRLEWELAGQSVRVLLFNNTANGLPPAAYSEALSIRFDVGALPGSEPEFVTVSLSDAVGALPDPADAGLTVDPAEHILEVHPPRAVLSVSSDSLAFGAVSVDDPGTLSLTLSNVAGSIDLQIASLATDNLLFSVDASPLTVPAGTSTGIDVTFSPTETLFGEQTSSLVITHDGDNGPETTVQLVGTGVGGRGDADGDGRVDIVDLVIGIDAALLRPLDPSFDAGRVDVFPFPAGDGSVDVRDLTVLVQAIVRDAWPDAVFLPIPFTPETRVVVAQQASARTAPASIELVESSNDDFDVYLNHEESLRAFELAVANVTSVSTLSQGGGDQIVSAHFDPETGRYRVALATLDGRALSVGRHWLGRVQSTTDNHRPDVHRAYGVDLNGRRIWLTAADVVVSTHRQADETPVETRLSIGAPYPNPFIPARDDVLSIPIAGVPGSARAHMELFDVLGRRVIRERIAIDGGVYEWRPTQILRRTGSGLYLLRITRGSESVSRPLTVLTGS